MLTSGNQNVASGATKRRPANFSEQTEHNALREAVMAVIRSFGAAYYAEHAREHRPTDELWQALSKQGFVGVNMPEEFRWRRRGA